MMGKDDFLKSLQHVLPALLPVFCNAMAALSTCSITVNPQVVLKSHSVSQ